MVRYELTKLMGRMRRYFAAPPERGPVTTADELDVEEIVWKPNPVNNRHSLNEAAHKLGQRFDQKGD